MTWEPDRSSPTRYWTVEVASGTEIEIVELASGTEVDPAASTGSLDCFDLKMGTDRFHIGPT